MAGGVRFVKNISMTLDPGSIQKAIDEVRDFQKRLKDAMQGLVEQLLEDGATHAKVAIFRMNAVDTGALAASIGFTEFDPGTRSGYVYAGAYYALFVEYGTGIIGAENPHPDPDAVNRGDMSLLAAQYQSYDSNGHGESGWWYVDQRGRRKWTKGMPARPFMYQTLRELEHWAERIGAELIGEYIL